MRASKRMEVWRNSVGGAWGLGAEEGGYYYYYYFHRESDISMSVLKRKENAKVYGDRCAVERGSL